MSLQKLTRPVAVEQLVFSMDPAEITRWIELDDQIWTSILSRCRGYIRKEIWQSFDHPDEVTSVVYWASYDQWKAIDPSLLKATCERFDRQFGAPYTLKEELHLHKQMFITYADTPEADLS
jgi:uncharacterized protein (TIGR03792 family)